MNIHKQNSYLAVLSVTVIAIAVIASPISPLTAKHANATYAPTTAPKTERPAQKDPSYIGLSSHFLFPGQKVKVHGVLFKPYEAVAVTAFGVTTAYVADTYGHFESMEIEVPALAMNRNVIIRAGGSRGSLATTTLMVGDYYIGKALLES